VRVARERDPGAIFRLGLLLLCGLTLAGGFVYAGGQHFAALKLGYQTESLRKIKKDLTEEQHRILLEREAAVSPARLEQAARQLGMQPMQAAQIDPLKRIGSSFTANAAPVIETQSVIKSSPAKAPAQAKAQPQAQAKVKPR
jgi:cell division protein FtsL